MTFITALVYLAGSFVCHQIPERSFHISGIQLPVCARCSGLYLGAVIGMAALLAASSRCISFAGARTLLIVTSIPTVVTAATAWVGLWDPANAVRATLALPLGFAVGAIVAAVLTRRLR
jgi:uncharacterized membrane protein